MTPAAKFLKTWLIAVRPFAYTGFLLSVALGLGISVYLGHPIRWGPFAVTMLGVVFFHTSANLLNDCFDHRRGLDTEVRPVSGAAVRNLLTERQVFKAAALFAALGAACGAYLVFRAGWVVLLLGAAGGFLAMSYTTPGRCLKYVGLGDLTIFLAFGVLPVFGAFWVQAQTFDWRPVLWSVPLVLPTVGILHANNWRDMDTEPAKGCRTFAHVLGDRGSAVYYATLTLGPFFLIALYFVLSRFAGAGLRSRRFGWLAAALAYCLVHLASGNLVLIGAALVCGLFWGCLFVRYDSLWANIVSHVVWDVGVFILFPFSSTS